MTTQTLAMSGVHRGGGPPDSGENPGGGWETIEKKSKKSGQAVGRGQWAPCSSSNAAPTIARQAWNGNGSSRPSANNCAQPSARRPAARGNPRPLPQTKSTETELQAPRQVATPPLAHGWQWVSRSRPSGSESKEDDVPSTGCDPEMDNAEDDDVPDDDNDDDMSDDISDDYDSDASEKSFETRKMNKWFKSFFEDLETLSVEQINEQTWQLHCPACKNGPGAISWYKGLQPLMTHARTKGSTRVKRHRELAKLLEEELSRMGTSVVPSGKQFGKWKGLRESTNHEIVWPPMVIVMNTSLEKDDDDKWKGMGNQELFDYFSEYAATKARHAYGPCGHRGMSVLIFESSAVGYMEAERLHRHFVEQRTDRESWHFVDQRTDRESWQNHKVASLPGGKRQLYGFLAKKEDLETFNKHCKGKNCLKYEMRSYHEMVVVQMKQMSEDNQQLNYVKNRMVQMEQHSKAVEENLDVATQKCRETMEENIYVKRKAKEMHLEHEQEMKFQENFFHDQMESIHEAMEEKEREYEKMLQEERARARQHSGTIEDLKLRKEQIEGFMEFQVKDVEEFEAERDELIKAHEEKKVKLKTEYMAKELELEKELDTALTALMEKHKPDTFQAASSS